MPDLAVDESRIVAPRLLAVRATPAEVEPGDRARYEALFVDDLGNVVEAPLAFFRCLRTRPLDELGPVASACLQYGAEGLDDPPRTLLGVGTDVQTTTPFDICSFFGPDPRALEGGATSRPASPDSTGGYRQPIVVELPEDAPVDIGTFEHRIRCNLAGARQVDAVTYRQRYRANVNPEISTVVATWADGRRQEDPEEISLSVGESVVLTVEWPTCPEEPACGDGVCLPSEDATSCAEDCRAPVGCAGAELFLRYDAVAQRLVTEREAMRVFWSASYGRFSVARTGVASEDRTSSSASTLIAEEPGAGHVHVVVRDERGGVGWRSFRLRVDP